MSTSEHLFNLVCCLVGCEFADDIKSRLFVGVDSVHVGTELVQQVYVRLVRAAVTIERAPQHDCLHLDYIIFIN